MDDGARSPARGRRRGARSRRRGLVRPEREGRALARRRHTRQAHLLRGRRRVLGGRLLHWRARAGRSPFTRGRPAPGAPMAMYHYENDQEDFLVVSGEALLIVEGEERPLRAWDFVHCPAGTDHIIVGAGAGPCVVVSTGSRTNADGDWGGYTVDDAALRHGAGVESATKEPKEAY